MLNKVMLIEKEIYKPYKINYFFIKGKIQIDSEYFIKKIQEACRSNDNLNHKTNLSGLMTNFKCFNKDELFINTISPLIEYVSNNKYVENPYFLKDAWGFEQIYLSDTKIHNHSNSAISGTIYLNDHKQSLEFPDIGEKVKCEKGSFAIFSSFLPHRCGINLYKTPRFGLSFNFEEKAF
jgi:hypothetical protein